MTFPPRKRFLSLVPVLLAAGASLGPAEHRPGAAAGEPSVISTLAVAPDSVEHRLLPPVPSIRLLPPEDVEPEAPRLVTKLAALRDRATRRERMAVDHTHQRTETVTDGASRSRRFRWTRSAALMLCGGLAVCGVGLMLVHWVQSRREIHPAVVTEPLVAPAVDLLKDLIANALPVVEAQTILPPLNQIFGRPVANLRYRLDAAQQAGDPHFTSEPAMPTESVAMEAAGIHWISPAGRRIDEPSSSQRGPSILERTLTTAQGDQP